MSKIRGTVNDQRDGQKAKVYRWENEVVGPRGGAEIGIGAAQGVVNHIWAEMGLQHPPQVKKLPANATTKWATADRFTLNMPSTIPTWVLLHELAHSMTMSFDQEANGPGAHNEIFVGVYMLLIEKFLKIDTFYLQHTATQYKVKYKLGARPLFMQ